MALTRPLLPSVVVNGNGTITTAHSVVYANTSTSLTLTLYPVAGNKGKSLTIVNIGTGYVVIDADGSELIDGISAKGLVEGESTTLHCDGTAWYTALGKNAYVGGFALGNWSTGGRLRMYGDGNNVVTLLNAGNGWADFKTGGLYACNGSVFLKRDLVDSGDRRNWGVVSEWTALGDVAIARSANNTAMPTVTAMQISKENTFTFNTGHSRMYGAVDIYKGFAASIANGASIYLCYQLTEYTQDYVQVMLNGSAGWNGGAVWDVMLDGYGALTPVKRFESSFLTSGLGTLDVQIAENHCAWLRFTNTCNSTLNPLRYTIVRYGGQAGQALASSYWNYTVA